MSIDAEPVFIDPEQLMFPGMGVERGERYANRNTGTIAAVLNAEQRHYGWVTVRIHGSVQTIRLDNFLRHYRRI